jgi:hypothetical protein
MWMTISAISTQAATMWTSPAMSPACSLTPGMSGNGIPPTNFVVGSSAPPDIAVKPTKGMAISNA